MWHNKDGKQDGGSDGEIMAMKMSQVYKECTAIMFD